MDKIEVRDPSEIAEIVANPSVDREFFTPTSLVNWFLLRRSLSALTVNGKRFPTQTPRSSAEDARTRDALWKALESRTASIRQGPAELDALAKWVRGEGADANIGIVTQQLLGQLFSPNFTATPESWQAAQVVVQAPRMGNLPKLLWRSLSGKVQRSRNLLSRMVGGNLSGVNAIGISVHNIAKGLEHMRQLYADEKNRSLLAPENVAVECIFAPISVYRQATASGNVSGCPFSRGSLFVLNLAVAAVNSPARKTAFLQGSWSSCPAAEWAPAMFEGVWRRALATGRASAI